MGTAKKFAAPLMLLAGVVFLVVAIWSQSSAPTSYGYVLSTTAITSGSANLLSKTLNLTASNTLVITKMTPCAADGANSPCPLMAAKPTVITLDAHNTSMQRQDFVAHVNCQLQAAGFTMLTYGPSMHADTAKPTVAAPDVTCTAAPTGQAHTLAGTVPPTCTCVSPEQTCGFSPVPQTLTCSVPFMQNADPTFTYRIGGLASHTCNAQLGLEEPYANQAALPASDVSHIGTVTKVTTEAATNVATLTMDAATFFDPGHVQAGDSVFRRATEQRQMVLVGYVQKAASETLTLRDVHGTLNAPQELFIYRPVLFAHPAIDKNTPRKSLFRLFQRNPAASPTTYYTSRIYAPASLTSSHLTVSGTNNTLALTVAGCSSSELAAAPTVTITVDPQAYTPPALMNAINAKLRAAKVPLKLQWAQAFVLTEVDASAGEPSWNRTANLLFAFDSRSCSADPAAAASVTLGGATTCRSVLGLPSGSDDLFTVSSAAPTFAAPHLMHDEASEITTPPPVTAANAEGNKELRTTTSTTPPSDDQAPGNIIPLTSISKTTSAIIGGIGGVFIIAASGQMYHQRSQS